MSGDTADREGVDRGFEQLLAFLKEERGLDLTGYKRPSLMRRVRRRMEEVGAADFEGYHDHLLVHPDEYTALFNAVLINVTGFFRDPAAWTYLKDQALPRLVRSGDGRPIRVWSAGCASGEEAYTLAMLLAELLGVDAYRQQVKIYATDVDEEALATARLASYAERDVAGVPPDLLSKYFERTGQRHVFSKELRRSVIFGRNDLVQDAPISHVDVLTCRNTLMYFNAETQSQIIQRLHFALKPDGVLLLGKAEMMLSHAHLFKAVDIKQRLFTKVDVPAGVRRFTGPTPRVLGGAADELSALRGAALMSSPAAVIVIGRDGHLAVTTHRAAALFGITPRDVGRPLQDLEVSYRPIELRARIEDAMAGRQQVWVRDVTYVRGNAEPLSFDVQITPLQDDEGALLGTSIVFVDVTQYRQLQNELEYANRQLGTAYEELQSTNEELETTNEELQSTVEELETTNEELQSTNEELETMNEELETMNEELETMNEELQSMNDELQMTGEAQGEQQEQFYRFNQYMTSVLASLDTGLVVVDHDLAVVTWNRMAEDLWGLRADEAQGQPLLDLDIGLPLDELEPALERQLSRDGRPQHERVRLSAVNRRGRPIDLDITVSRLVHHGDGVGPQLLLAMHVLDGGA